MARTVEVPARTILEGLAWDSAHFGFPVGQIAAPELGDEALLETLYRSRDAGFRLVYWAARPERQVRDELLRRFAGRLVDRKVTFRARPAAASPSGAWEINEYPRTVPSQRLLDLAVRAGEHSRFRVDPLVPRGRFEALYRTWMHRSALREIADAVLTASAPGEEPVGTITLAVKEGVGWIGLIAVHESAAGRGVGTDLMRAAHEWLAGRGVEEAAVVTQLDNRAACRLYEKAGYAPAEVVNYYHFWLQEADALRRAG